MTILGIADLLISKLGANNQAQVVSQYRAGDIRHCVADINKAKNLLAYEPRVHLEDGIDELIEWLQHQTAYDRLAAATQELSERGLTF